MLTPRHVIRALIVAAMILLTAASSLAAQSDGEITSPEDFGGFAWLANRFYIHDPEALRDAVADVATPENIPPVMAIVMVMAFESEREAEAAFIPYSELMAESASSEMEQASEGEPVDDVGDEALAFSATGTSEDYPVDTTTLTVRDGDVIYLSISMTANGTSGDLSRELMDRMLAGEMSDDEVVFDPTGESTGGAFALFPTEGDEILGGMGVQSDQYLAADD